MPAPPIRRVIPSLSRGKRRIGFVLPGRLDPLGAAIGFVFPSGLSRGKPTWRIPCSIRPVSRGNDRAGFEFPRESDDLIPVAMASTGGPRRFPGEIEGRGNSTHDRADHGRDAQPQGRLRQDVDLPPPRGRLRQGRAARPPGRHGPAGLADARASSAPRRPRISTREIDRRRPLRRLGRPGPGRPDPGRPPSTRSGSSRARMRSTTSTSPGPRKRATSSLPSGRSSRRRGGRSASTGSTTLPFSATVTMMWQRRRW